ncbi:ParB/RepB/Spo0J family partition protein (plasmid) [Myxococcus sp. MxC21-1]|uniref:ParB/RepB/Spo0J family partition protein n=1 Tax=Myxococcus sp. MxC21-1 TaxID=3041439 RepID=UPI00292FF413|nr:ParB/RepB/Spo0J family partition protein [Myxococcus sp. MxC21-1]WNZ66236.1 ParB/RepB/Spo0J family partition protein [Myxococcus sp. MxC21-1]
MDGSLPTDAVVAPLVMQWPVVQLMDSPFQPRQTYCSAKLSELAESIRVHGIQQPLLVRRLRDDEGRAEIIVGHRRMRGAVAAGLLTVPVIFREATDAEVRELQHVENLCREDVHPLEEAASFRALMADLGYSAERLAARTGKSRAYVVRRLSLNDLCADVTTAFREGSLSEYGALCLSRLATEDLQRQALVELLDDVDIASDARCRRVTQRYMLSLAEAAFDKTHETLLPGVGSCLRCPKRTGANADLFGEFSEADLCTDGGCFAQKLSATWTALCEEALSRGEEVMDEEASKAVLGYSGYLLPRSGFVDLKSWCSVGGERTWKDVLGESCPPVTLAVDGAGRPHHLVRERDAEEVLGLLGLILPAGGSSGDAAAVARPPEPTPAEQRHRQRVRRSTVDAALAAMVAASEQGPLPLEVLRYLVAGVLDASWHEIRRAVAKRRGFVTDDSGAADVALVESVATMTAEQLVGLLVEVVAVRCAVPTYSSNYGASFLRCCEFFGLDVVALEAAATTELETRSQRSRPKKRREQAGAPGHLETSPSQALDDVASDDPLDDDQ